MPPPDGLYSLGRLGLMTIAVNPTIAIIPSIPMLPALAISPKYALIAAFAITIVPSMLWASVGVNTAVVDIVTTEHPSGIVGDFVSDRRMMPQKISYFFVSIEIVAIVNQPWVGL